MSRLFKRKLQRLAEGGRYACLSVLLDGWPSGTAYRKGYAKLGDISLSQIMPCVTAPDEEEEEEEEEEVEAETRRRLPTACSAFASRTFPGSPPGPASWGWR